MLNMCEQRLSKEEVNKYKRAFAIFDDTGDGTITSEVILHHLYHLSKIGGIVVDQNVSSSGLM